jgi:glycosyltransferase involved in cell wall biosynthesis
LLNKDKDRLRVAIDIRPALRQMTGVGTYVYNLTTHLIKNFNGISFKLFTSSLKDRFEQPLPSADNFKVYDYRFPVKSVNLMFNTFRFPPVQFFLGSFNIYHSPSPILPPLLKCKKVITVHDIYFLLNPYETQKESRNTFNKLILSHLNNADKIIAVSNFTANELLNRFNIPKDKVEVIYHGSDHIEKIKISSKTNLYQEKMQKHLKNKDKAFKIKNNFNPESKIILFAGRIEPRKNLDVLIDGFEILLKSKKYPLNLILAGDIGWEMSGFEKKIMKFGDQVSITGYLSREDLNNLYRSADILVMPSKYEGFGLPVIEAMNSGLPVITANNSSLPEIGGEAAMYFETNSPESLASAIEQVLYNEKLYNEMVIKGLKRADDFRWETAAEKTVQLYKSII